ncbi:mucin-16-like [Narcine bancroftii]|uniref:mucin-16-like n=1 Tax=Narcine bancroftii TaxID=1343680 RepID=UPI0038310370
MIRKYFETTKASSTEAPTAAKTTTALKTLEAETTAGITSALTPETTSAPITPSTSETTEASLSTEMTRVATITIGPTSTTAETTTTIASITTAELTSISTPPVTEISSSSIQTFTNIHGSSSSTIATTSEASSLITVEPPIVPKTVKPIETQRKLFNITFNVLTLPFTPSLQNLSSPLYQNEARNVLNELNNLYANSNVKLTFSKCQTVSFRSASDGNSTVEAICIFKIPAFGQEVNKVQLYREFQNNSEDITILGSYTLDTNSLFVDGYHESSVLTSTAKPQIQTTTPVFQVNPFEFNVTFILTNLASTEDLKNPNSLDASHLIVTQLSQIYNNSNIKETFSSCKVISFSSGNAQSTRVYANCTFSIDSDPQQVNSVTVYNAFRENTNGITTFPPYSLDSNSLYVNGYHESTLSTTSPIQTTSPISPVNPFEFNVTFVLTNLASTVDLQNSNSSLFKSASSLIVAQLSQIYNDSNIKETFSSCKVISFSSGNAQSTRVYANCTFSIDSDPQQVNSVTVYNAFRENTNGITTFPPYSLDSNSLYVNGYHESTLSTTSPIQTTSPISPVNPFEFNVTFVLTNLASTADLQNSNSSLFKSASSLIVAQLSQIYNNGNIKETFSSCKVISFSSVNVQSTRVYANCSFRNDSDPQEVNSVTVYNAFRENTNGITTFPPYSLHSNSLYVNGYHESTLSTTSPIQTTSPISPVNPFEFNVTFVLTNLASTVDLQNSNSLLFKSASSLIVAQLSQIYKNSNIKETFSSCKVISFSSGNAQSTRVYANCTFSIDSDPQQVNSVTVYNAFRENTNGITTFPPYSLDSNSLYVNGYHESTLSTTSPIQTTSPISPVNPFEFNVTFVLTNLASTVDLQNSNSSLFKSASSLIVAQLSQIYNNGNIKETFSSCKVISFSSVNVQSTRVYANCSFRNDSDPQEVNSVTVYNEFRKYTNGITIFPPYSLDSNSLYVNDYHESMLSTTPPPIQVMNPFDFNVTFDITDLASTEFLQNPKSTLFNSASRLIVAQLNKLFRNSKINKEFSSCKLLSLSPGNEQSTRVLANCTFRNDSDPLEVNSVTVYNEFRKYTKGITTFPPYSLDSNSLYVNGYHEFTLSTTPPPIQVMNPFDFNVTFDITDLASTEFLQNPKSSLFNSASRLIVAQLNKLFRNSKINKEFSSCKLLSLSPGNEQSTRVLANCTFRNDSDPLEVNSVTVYNEFRKYTKGITTFPPYSLDSNSLYVNGYHEFTLSTTPPPIQVMNPFDFNVTFDITDLASTEFLQNPKSSLFNSASRLIVAQLNKLFRNSKIKKEFSSCKLLSLSPGNEQSTRVLANCTFRNDSDPLEVNSVTVYNEFRKYTKGITTFPPYSLDSNSLYVNGYHEFTLSTTPPPIQVMNHFDFNVTFVITDLASTAFLQNPDSLLYNSASRLIVAQLNKLFRNSEINKRFSGCEVLSLSAEHIQGTRVNAKCTFRNDSDPQEVNKVTVYRMFRDQTEGISTFGIYLLESNSLYVNGYTESTPSISESPIVVVTVQPNKETRLLDFNVTFTITNLKFTQNLQNLNTPEYERESNDVLDSLNKLYSKSKIAETFSNCNRITFSPGNTEDTKVEALCSFKNDPTKATVNKVTVYNEFRDNTEEITELGTHSLNENSLYVNGYQELKPVTQPTLSTLGGRNGDLSFEVNFTIINRNFTEALNDQNSPEFQRIVAKITAMLTKLYTNSLLKDSYRTCVITGLRSGSIKCTYMCYFNPNAANELVTVDKVKTEFARGTNEVETLGNNFQLQRDSLSVEAEEPVSSGQTEIPQWGIILLVLGILFILFILFLCFGLILCLKKKKQGFYDTLQNPS